MERILCLAIGYLFGLFQTGYLYGKAHGIDIRQYGSGNSGTTNALRVLGKKAGLIVFAGDFLKTVIPCVAVRLYFGNSDMGHLLMLYTGLGVILGHNYPCYLHFKGGKGIAATAGILVASDLRITLVCMIAFILIVALTRFVSLGSMVVVTIFLIMNICFAAMGEYGLTPVHRIEYDLVAAVITGMAVWRHRANIVRLIHGTENPLWGKDKKK